LDRNFIDLTIRQIFVSAYHMYDQTRFSIKEAGVEDVEYTGMQRRNGDGLIDSN